MADYKKGRRSNNPYLEDFWQIRARNEGYPARSVYKLKEMDEKFSLLKPGMAKQAGGLRVLDLGAAPGSWSLYVLRKIPQATLVAADISPLSRQYDKGLFDTAAFHFIRGDITDPAVREFLVTRGPYNLILSDAAPSTTGNRFVDTCASLELAEAVASYTETALVKGGSLAVKVFQGGDTSQLLKRFKTLFNTARSYKPEACRSESFEVYYLGLDRK